MTATTSIYGRLGLLLKLGYIPAFTPNGLPIRQPGRALDYLKAVKR